ncbi:MAG: ABC transporter ATP-binding protein, partial [Dehalococcoidia bacterium]
MNVPLHQYSDLLLGYLRHQRTRVAILAVLLLTSTMLPLFNPQIVRTFIDRAVDGDATSTLVLLAVLFIVAAIVTQVVQVAATYLAEQVGWIATNMLRADLAMHVLRLDMPFHNVHTPGEMIERIDGDVTALSNFFSQFVIYILGSGLLLIGVLVMMTLADWRVGLVMSVFTAAALLLLLRIRNLAVPQATAEREVSAQLFGFVEERLQGLDDIRTSGAGDYVMRRFYEKGRDLYRSALAAQKASAWVWMTTMSVFTLGYAITLGMGAWLYLQGAVTIGTVYLFFQYVQMLRRPLEMIAEQLKEFQKASAGVSRVHELKAVQSTIVDIPVGARLIAPNGRDHANGARDAPAVVGTINHAPTRGPLAVQFHDVTFGYGEGESVLQDVSVDLQPGQVLGVLGRTGSGKTTLTRLLLRLYEPRQGTIRLGGVEIHALPLDELRRQI